MLSNERLSGNPAAGWNDFEPTIDRLVALAATARIPWSFASSTTSPVRSGFSRSASVTRPASRISGACRDGDHRLPVRTRASSLRSSRRPSGSSRGARTRAVLPYELLRRDAGSCPESRLSAASRCPALGRETGLRGLARGRRAPSCESLVGPQFPQPRPAWRTREDRSARPHSLDDVLPRGRTATSRSDRRDHRGSPRPLDLPSSNRRLADRLGVDLEAAGWT